MLLKLRLYRLYPLTNRKAGNCVTVDLVLAKHDLITQIVGLNMKHERKFVNSLLLACKIKVFENFFFISTTLVI
jgi:hypothetical protein